VYRVHLALLLWKISSARDAALVVCFEGEMKSPSCYFEPKTVLLAAAQALGGSGLVSVNMENLGEKAGWKRREIEIFGNFRLV